MTDAINQPNLTQKLTNGVVSWLIRAGIGPAGRHMLSVPGRASGKRHSTPVHVVNWQGDRWLVAPFGVVEWVKNARAAGEVILSRQGRSLCFAIVEVDSEHRAPILQRYLEESPWLRRQMGLAANSAVEDYERASRSRPVFLLIRKQEP